MTNMPVPRMRVAHICRSLSSFLIQRPTTRVFGWPLLSFRPSEPVLFGWTTWIIRVTVHLSIGGPAVIFRTRVMTLGELLCIGITQVSKAALPQGGTCAISPYCSWWDRKNHCQEEIYNQLLLLQLMIPSPPPEPKCASQCTLQLAPVSHHEAQWFSL
jgi:hypothetical protein